MQYKCVTKSESLFLMGRVNSNGVIITVLLRLFFYNMVRGGSFGDKRIIGALFCGIKTSRYNDSTYHVSGVEGRENRAVSGMRLGEHVMVFTGTDPRHVSAPV